MPWQSLDVVGDGSIRNADSNRKQRRSADSIGECLVLGVREGVEEGEGRRGRGRREGVEWEGRRGRKEGEGEEGEWLGVNNLIL